METFALFVLLSASACDTLLLESHECEKPRLVHEGLTEAECAWEQGAQRKAGNHAYCMKEEGRASSRRQIGPAVQRFFSDPLPNRLR